MILYNLFSSSQGVRITKWDDDFNVAASYLVSDQGCECPAAKPCKHMNMLRKWRSEIDKNTFFEPETSQCFELKQ